MTSFDDDWNERALRALAGPPRYGWLDVTLVGSIITVVLVAGSVGFFGWPGIAEHSAAQVLTEQECKGAIR